MKIFVQTLNPNPAQCWSFEGIFKLTMRILVLLFFLASLGCATGTSNIKNTSCWNEKNVSLVLEKLTAVSNTMGKATGGSNKTPILISESCSKRKYQFGNTYLILKNQAGAVDGKTIRVSDNPERCLNRGQSELENDPEGIYREVQKRHKEKHPDQWSDVDLSPVGWLNCDSSQSDFDDSVTTFIHELTHQLRENEKECVYLAVEKRYLCFHFPETLPLRSYGKQSTFPTHNSAAIKGLETIQKIYLTDIDQPLIMLIDEWNAYILSNESYMDRLRKYGNERIFDQDGKRPGIFSVLFYKIAMTYMERLSRENPSLYKSTFEKNEANRKSIADLIAATRRVYLDWVHELKTNKRSEKDFERAIFRDAERISKSLHLNY